MVDLASGAVESHHVAHGRGSDMTTQRVLERFHMSGTSDSNGTSTGTIPRKYGFR